MLVVEPLWQPVGAAHGTKLCSILPWKNSAFESNDPRLGQRIQGVDNFCQKVVCVCCCCCCCFTAIRLCSWCYLRQISVRWSNCAGARHLSDWFCGRLKNHRCSKHWLLALDCRTFHHQTKGNPRLHHLTNGNPRQFTTRLMGTPDNSPLDKWELQVVHHQTNGKPRQFTTKQMETPVNSPPDKCQNGNPGQFTASRASMCCCAIFFVMNLTSMHACPHKHTCMCTHTHMYACMHTRTHTHTCIQKHTHTLVNCHRLSFTSVVNGPHSFPSHLCHCYLFTCNRKGAGAVSAM